MTARTEIEVEALAKELHIHSAPFDESRTAWGGLYVAERDLWLGLARYVLAALDAARKAGIEEAAKVCESYKEHLWPKPVDGTHAGAVAQLLAGAIRDIAERSR